MRAGRWGEKTVDVHSTADASANIATSEMPISTIPKLGVGGEAMQSVESPESLFLAALDDFEMKSSTGDVINLIKRIHIPNVSPSDFLDLEGIGRRHLLHPIYQMEYNCALSSMIVKFMPASPAHHGPVDWMTRELTKALYKDQNLTRHYDNLSFPSKVDHAGFGGDYEGSRKVPDYAVGVDSIWPTVIMEVGWSEPIQDLREDAKLWLLGSQAAERSLGQDQIVNLVILVDLKMKEDIVDVQVELWKLKREQGRDIILELDGIACHFQKSFVVPGEPVDSFLPITLKECFGASYCDDKQLEESQELLLPLDALYATVKKSIPKQQMYLEEIRKLNVKKKERKEEEEVQKRKDTEDRREEDRDARDARMAKSLR